MADNLKQITANVDSVINPLAAVGGIKAVDHNALLKDFISKSGKYTGIPYLSQDMPNAGGAIPAGVLSWNNNVMNDTNNFVISLNKQTLDNNDIGIILSTVINGANIRFKDFVGRSVFLQYVSHLLTDDGNGNDIYEITVKGKIENINYAYQPGEKESCILEFYNNALSLPNAPGIEGDVIINQSGGFSVLNGFNYDVSSDTLTLPMTLKTRDLSFGTVNETVDFEGGDFTGTGFTTDGDQDWFVDNVVSSSGLYSARSGGISNLQVSNLYKTITVSGANNAITFSVFTDTEEGGDVLDFFVKDTATLKEKYVKSWSGSNPFSVFHFVVNAGTYDLRWVYRKDSNTVGGADVVRIDLFKTQEVDISSNFSGLNLFNDINVFDGDIEFRGKVLGDFNTNSDIVVNSLKIGNGASNVSSNLIIGTEISPSGSYLTKDSFGNTAIGANAFPLATSALSNTAIGNNSLRDLTTGGYNVAVGEKTLRGVVTGSGNVGIGRVISNHSPTMSNTFFINNGDGLRYITIDVTGASLPDQTIAKITAGNPNSIATKEYVEFSLGAAPTIATTGATYTTFKEAYDAGIRVMTSIGNSVETADTVISESVKWTINAGVTADFGTFNITSSSNDISFVKNGEGFVRYASTTLNKPFFNAGAFTNNTFKFNGGKWINESTQNGCYIAKSENQNIFDAKLVIPNFASCGVLFENDNCFLKNTLIECGGTNCSDVINFYNGIIKDIIFIGSVDQVNATINKSDYFGSISFITIHTSNSVRINLLSGILKDVVSTQELFVLLQDNNCIIENLNIEGGVTIDMGGYDNHILNNLINLKLLGTGPHTGIHASNVEISSTVLTSLEFYDSNFLNIVFRTSGLTLSGDRNNFSNLNFLNGDFNIIGDKTNISNCNAKNIIIQATANGTKICNSESSVAPTQDLGTNTLMVNTI